LRITVDRRGPVYSREPDGDYICVRVESGSVCQDCAQDESGWTANLSATVTYVAEGSLDNVATDAYLQICRQPQTTADIADGERATIQLNIDRGYERSQSPEELGYEPFN
jgi:hypothetical protein